jgi:protein required for attachment to host cells
MRRTKRTGIVVADGVKAKILRWDNETDTLQELAATSIELVGERPPAGASCSDRVPDRFAHAVTHMLETHREAGCLVRLIFVAPGPVLDNLAAGLPDDLKRLVVGELAQNMMHAPSAAVRDALRNA